MRRCFLLAMTDLWREMKDDLAVVGGSRRRLQEALRRSRSTGAGGPGAAEEGERGDRTEYDLRGFTGVEELASGVGAASFGVQKGLEAVRRTVAQNANAPAVILQKPVSALATPVRRPVPRFRG